MTRLEWLVLIFLIVHSLESWFFYFKRNKNENELYNTRLKQAKKDLETSDIACEYWKKAEKKQSIELLKKELELEVLKKKQVELNEAGK